MQNASQFSKNGVFRLQKIGEIYKDYMKHLSWPAIDPVNVMDIGCADGEVSTKILYPLLPKNCKEFICTDVDNGMVEHCKSLKVDDKVSFKQLDITAQTLPDQYKKRFNFLFSSYCFTSVRNFRQALVNSNQLLKSNGEFLFFFMYKKNHLLTTYRRLNEIEAWRPYTQEFADFVPHFSSADPDKEAKQLLKDTGFNAISNEFRNDCYYDATARCHLGIYLSVDTIRLRVPKEKRKQYDEDFRRILSEETAIDFLKEDKLDEVADLHIPTVILTARKQE
ncbi:hypothetical protein WA026_001846 [Henosepilachna vigintioctopunctata]|uniref:Methyltransferase type 11 domain-containing protein n=1 Tax=Henosepilachna vigintioctopunctata TaxID=420089 RepID=A0AAW1UJF1_9CUCU